MTKKIDRLSMWKSRQDPVFHAGPAKLVIEDDYAVIKVSPRQWPGGLDSDQVIGWPVLASEKTDDGTEVVYEGEIHDVEETARMSGVVRKLRCKPACDAQSQVSPSAFKP